MQRSGATPTQTAAPFFSSFFGGGGGNGGANHSNNNSSSPAKSRPGTSSGDPANLNGFGAGVDSSPARQPNVLHKDRDRRPSFSRKSSFPSSPSKSGKRRTNSSGGSANGGLLGLQVVTGDNSIPPLPDFALAAAAKLSRETDALQSPASVDSFSKMLSRTAPTPVNGYSAAGPGLAPPAVVAPGQPSELSAIHQGIIEMANKRISTLDYLRKRLNSETCFVPLSKLTEASHEGRVYWFNTLLFDKPDLARMPYFDSRRLARRATNYLLLGISLPTVIDLNSGNPTEFLRSLNTLFAEFEAFQTIHSETGTTSSSLSRARIPHMFRRATGPSITKGRRSSNANTASLSGTTTAGAPSLNDTSYSFDSTDSISGSTINAASQSNASLPSSASTNSIPPASVINFAGAETDLLPGEEYSHLLTPSLPFDPDFFETFATLCDVLIDTYTRLLSLVPTPRECGGGIGDLFTKMDGRVRKIIIQGVVKEFEDSTRSNAKAEVANIGKVVLSGLM